MDRTSEFLRLLPRPFSQRLVPNIDSHGSKPSSTLTEHLAIVNHLKSRISHSKPTDSFSKPDVFALSRRHNHGTTHPEPEAAQDVSPGVAVVLASLDASSATESASKTLAETGSYLSVISQQVAYQAELASSVLDTVEESVGFVDKAAANFKSAASRSSNTNWYLTVWFLVVALIIGLLDAIF